MSKLNALMVCYGAGCCRRVRVGWLLVETGGGAGGQ